MGWWYCIKTFHYNLTILLWLISSLFCCDRVTFLLTELCKKINYNHPAWSSFTRSRTIIDIGMVFMEEKAFVRTLDIILIIMIIGRIVGCQYIRYIGMLYVLHSAKSTLYDAWDRPLSMNLNEYNFIQIFIVFFLQNHIPAVPCPLEV